MNLFYEKLPDFVNVGGQEIEIITDFREVIKFIDILKSEELTAEEKAVLSFQYFKQEPADPASALLSYWDFVKMKDVFEQCKEEPEENEVGEVTPRTLFSFEVDYPYIYAAFLRDYGIDLQKVPYMHWWNFRMLFDGLAEDNEIKKRIMYRSVDLSKIKDKEERRRIERIQRSIALAENRVSDFDIGNALM